MMRALFTGASGMRGQQFRIDVTSNNLANVNTTGFKSDRAEFQDLVYQNLRRPGGTSATGTQWPTGLQVGLGVNAVATSKDFSQGSPIDTGRPLDLAVQGEGFFQVQMPDGSIAYTRAGSFHIDNNGDLLTAEGLHVIPNINLPEGDASMVVSPDGTVQYTPAGNNNSTQVGQITLVKFINPQGLKAIGSTLLTETDSSGPPQEDTPGQNGLGTIRQGSYEASNASVVDELVNLIIAQRAYEANSRSVMTSDEMLQTAVNLKR